MMLLGTMDQGNMGATYNMVATTSSLPGILDFFSHDTEANYSNDTLSSSQYSKDGILAELLSSNDSPNLRSALTTPTTMHSSVEQNPFQENAFGGSSMDQEIASTYSSNVNFLDLNCTQNESNKYPDFPPMSISNEWSTEPVQPMSSNDGYLPNYSTQDDAKQLGNDYVPNGQFSQSSLLFDNSMNCQQNDFVKQGLKAHIQTKRIATGRGPLSVESMNLQETYEMTVEDEEKNKLRRERNKVAATKCRKKKQAKTVELVDEEKREEEINNELKVKIEELRKEYGRLRRVLDNHSHGCRLYLSSSSSSSSSSSNPDHQQFTSSQSTSFT